MKKELTVEQYEELFRLGYKGGRTIGDLIEFLDEHVEQFEIRGHIIKGGVLLAYPKNVLAWDVTGGDWSSIEDEPILCDALWEAVKKVIKTHDK